MAKGGKREGAGRPAGSKNKVGAEVRAALGEQFALSMPKILRALDSLESEPEKYLSAWVKLLPYFAPKLQSVGITEVPEGTRIVSLDSIIGAVNLDKSV